MNTGDSPNHMSIRTRVQDLRDRVGQAARMAGRDPADIRIVAAVKARSSQEIRELLKAGVTDLGENQVQSLLSHAKDLAPSEPVPSEPVPSEPAPSWHFIGRIQSNKVAVLAREVDLVQTVDRLSIGEAFSRTGVKMNILVQVNVSGEASKGGVTPEDLPQLARDLANLPNICVRGLMCIPDPGDPERGFARLRDLRDQAAEQVPTCRDLSMGMSDDLELAISAGATIIRPGVALFGPRAK